MDLFFLNHGISQFFGPKTNQTDPYANPTRCQPSVWLSESVRSAPGLERGEGTFRGDGAGVGQPLTASGQRWRGVVRFGRRRWGDAMGHGPRKAWPFNRIYNKRKNVLEAHGFMDWIF